MKKLLLTVALMAAMVGTANATALTGTVARYGGVNSSARGVVITLSAALTSSDTGTASWDASDLMGYSAGGGTGDLIISGIAWGMLSTTVGDSASIAIAGSMDPAGPFQNIYVSTLQANTLTGAVNMQARDDGLSVLKPYRYHQITIGGKGASMAVTKKFYVIYPRSRQ